MGILYIITLIILGISFMMFKKTDEKINFIKWLIIYVVSLFGYNVVIGMILGLLNITSDIWLLSIINLVVSLILSYRVIRYKETQKYFVRKLEIAGILIILAIFAVMFVKDLYIYKGDITHFAVDSSIHYRAAKHYSDNLKIFVNVEDKTFFNFNVMQTGAYINDGIFMNVINEIAGLDHCYIYQIFETLVLFLSGLSFYAAVMEKVKTKKGLIGTLILFALYIYGYPYNSWIYGFSYLSVGIMMVSMLLAVVEFLYSEEKINKVLVVILIGILATGLIFSYCLFVPAIFASICIYTFLKDFTVEGKTFLKIFKKTTLIVTGMLLVITAVGIGYLFVPTFYIEGQTNLVSALKIDGAIYSEKLTNFIPYVPFAILYFAEIIKRIKNKSLRYMDVFAVCIMGCLACLYLGLRYGLVAPYYMLKVYFIMWMVIFAVTIDLVNEYIDTKIFRIDAIIFALFSILFYALIHSRTSAMMQSPIPVEEKFKELVNAAKVYVGIIIGVFLAIYAILPEILKKIDLEKFEKLKKINLKTTGFVCVVIWGVFVFSWVWIKAGHVIGEEKKHSLPNLVGIYYLENCEHRKLIDLMQNFNSKEIEVVKYARENIEDLTANNIELITGGYYYNRIWATALLEITSDDIRYENFVQDMTPYTVETAINNPEKKYIVQVVIEEQQGLEAYRKDLEEVKKMDEIEILFENENGFVAKINR